MGWVKVKLNQWPGSENLQKDFSLFLGLKKSA